MQEENRKTQYEKMTATPIPKLVISLAIPSIISMLINNVYNLVDAAFVGVLGKSATGAIGVVFGFMAIIQAFAFMFGQGAGSILSRALGRQDKATASIHASVGFFGSTLVGLLITIIGFIWLDDIVMLLGSTVTIAPYARTYITYILIAAPLMSGSLTLNNVLRFEAKANLGMIGLLIGAILNMGLDPVLMFAFNMGIAGAGLATAISQFVSWSILLSMFLFNRTETKLSLSGALHAGIKVFGNVLATGLPSLLRQGLNSITTVLLNSQCRVYGDAAVAGMSIVSRVVFFVFSIALGIGQGFQPVSAFNYGAGKYSRLKSAFKFGTLMSEIIIIVGCSFLVAFAEGIVGIFSTDSGVVEVGTRALVLQAIASITLPFAMMTEMLFQSTGKKLDASFISALRSGIIFIPVLLLMAHFRGLAGIQEAQPLALLLSVPVAIPFAVKFFKTLPKVDKDDKPNEA